MRIIYTYLFYLSLPWVLLRLFFKGKHNPAYRQRIAQRLALYWNTPSKTATLWIHAASLGEVMALIPLVESLLDDFSVVMTTMTPSGSAVVERLLANRVSHVYVPYDLPGMIKRFIAHYGVRCLLIMETELWPNMIHVAKKRGLSIALINARVSDRSFSSYRRIAFFMRPMLQKIDWILAKSEEDAQRFIALGAPFDQVGVGVNIKFAVRPLTLAEKSKSQCVCLRPSWIAASTHPGEEEIVLQAHQRLKKQWPDLLLILVPRHSHRVASVASLIEACGLSYICSNQQKPALVVNTDVDVCLVNEMGVLCQYYQLSNMAFVGGSLLDFGGHNLIEPAANGAVIISGPYLNNFLAVRDLLLANDALCLVEDVNSLADCIDGFLSNPSQQKAMQTRAWLLLQSQRKHALSPIHAWVRHAVIR